MQGGLGIAIMLAFYILLSVLYTAGPFPLAYLGLGDVFVLFLYGPAATIITYYLQTAHLSKEAFFAGLSPGALSMALLVINNIRDHDEDKGAKKKTLVVRFGRKFGKYQFLFSILLALLPLAVFAQEHPFCLLALLILLPCHSPHSRRRQSSRPSPFEPCFWKTGQLLWLFTLLFCIGWML